MLVVITLLLFAGSVFGEGAEIASTDSRYDLFIQPAQGKLGGEVDINCYCSSKSSYYSDFLDKSSFTKNNDTEDVQFHLVFHKYGLYGKEEEIDIKDSVKYAVSHSSGLDAFCELTPESNATATRMRKEIRITDYSTRTCLKFTLTVKDLASDDLNLKYSCSTELSKKSWTKRKTFSSRNITLYKEDGGSSMAKPGIFYYHTASGDNRMTQCGFYSTSPGTHSLTL